MILIIQMMALKLDSNNSDNNNDQTSVIFLYKLQNDYRSI